MSQMDCNSDSSYDSDDSSTILSPATSTLTMLRSKMKQIWEKSKLPNLTLIRTNHELIATEEWLSDYKKKERDTGRVRVKAPGLL